MSGSPKGGARRNTNRISRDHFTRSRKPTRLPSTPYKTKPEEPLKSKKDVDDKFNFSINACATILAELDSKSYQKCLVQDANNITERILQPMSLPWTHKVVPVARNIPCDIDEMIDVVTADDGFHAPFNNGNFGFGQFETGRIRRGDSLIRFANSSDNFHAAARRSTDPGVMEFSTVVLPPTPHLYHPEVISMVQSPLPVASNERNDDSQSIEGSTIYRCFETMQGLKRRKIAKARSCVTSFEISVKINSSSSRSSIFSGPSVEHDLNNVILEAILPLEVENGRRMSKARAKIASEILGSYKIPHATPQIQNGKQSSRTLMGRTRLMWTRKRLSDQPQRVFFTSLVTGQNLESGAEKRPRNIRVRIKFDSDITNGGKLMDLGKPDVGIKLQASLHCDKLVQNLLDGRSDQMNFSYFIPPVIECVPDSAGSIHVVCTSLGKILQTSISPILSLKSKKSNPCCSICWRSTEGGLEVKECIECGLFAHIECCLDPGEYRTGTNDQVRNKQWTCSVCCYHKKNHDGICGTKNQSQMVTAIKKSKRKSRPPSRLKDAHFESKKPQKIDHPSIIKNKEIKCAICLLSGGAMSPISVEGEKIWVHEICRIWTSDQRYSTISKKQSCILCGAGNSLPIGLRYTKDESMQDISQKRYSSQCVVKCAAAGCHISVHPMCALLSSMTSQSINEVRHEKPESNTTSDNITNAKNHDIDLCSQYTLTFASVRGSAQSFGKDPGARCESILPIVFCGIHNPGRDQSFHGLYPGGKNTNLEQAFKIPSC